MLQPQLRERVKAIRKDVIEGEFATLFKQLQSAPRLIKLALAMFRQGWDPQAAQASELRWQVRRRADEIAKQSAPLLARDREAGQTEGRRGGKWGGRKG